MGCCDADEALNSLRCPLADPEAWAPLHQVLSSWMSELKRFCPELRAIKLHSSDLEERRRLMSSLAASTSDVDVVVTT